MATAELSQVYVESATIPTTTPRNATQLYVEAATVPTVTPRNLSNVYIEVLTSSSRPFIGWGVPA